MTHIYTYDDNILLKWQTQATSFTHVKQHVSCRHDKHLSSPFKVHPISTRHELCHRGCAYTECLPTQLWPPSPPPPMAPWSWKKWDGYDSPGKSHFTLSEIRLNPFYLGIQSKPLWRSLGWHVFIPRHSAIFRKISKASSLEDGSAVHRNTVEWTMSGKCDAGSPGAVPWVAIKGCPHGWVGRLSWENQEWFQGFSCFWWGNPCFWYLPILFSGNSQMVSPRQNESLAPRCRIRF